MEDYTQKKNASVQRRILLIALLLLLLLFVLLAIVRVRKAAPVAVADSAALPEFNDTAAMDVYFIDVGQGDAILIRSPNGKIMLVDAGPTDSFYAVWKLMQHIGADKIDVIVCTHAHIDHIGAMPRVIESYEIGHAFFPHGAVEQDYGEIFAQLKQRGVEPEAVTADMTSLLSFDPSLEVRVLSPFDTDYEDENESSLVLRIGYENTSVLLTADTGALAERLMLKALPNVFFDSDVLKLGHHGSYSSTSEKFLEAVSPGLAIASCAKDNAYGHPDPELRALLEKHAVPLMTTGDYGTIHVRLDGTHIRVVEYANDMALTGKMD